MKRNSPLLYLVLCGITLLSTGCDNKTEPNEVIEETPAPVTSELTIGITNSYLFHTEPELLPQTKLIKQQKITGTGDKTINYNEAGYVESYDLQKLHAEVNYDTSTYLYQEGENKIEYFIHFDDIKNILEMENHEDETVAKSEYDEQGRLIETTLSHFAGNNVIFRSQIIYGQDQVDQVLYTAYVPIDDKTKFPIFSQEKKIIYNENKQLAKTVVKTFKLSSDGEIIINQNNEQEVEITETCDYSNYNSNGDWTKAECITTGDEDKISQLSRTIEYK
ncbi:hypothetical protein PT276_09040 [Orbaceae bacterium ESL0721]|nr:hypothetical protein [Orbaceae bacterium ESL0721]